jgi:hypothetical protein
MENLVVEAKEVVVKPFGPHPCTRCFGLVHASKTSSRGASNTRVVRIVRACPVPRLFLASMLLLLGLKFREIIVQLVEAGVPEAAILFKPVVDVLEGGRLDPAWPPLRLAAARAMRPARSSTVRCFETAGRLISKGSASPVTDVSPRRAARGSHAASDRREPRG